jgi:hypothetical protein
MPDKPLIRFREIIERSHMGSRDEHDVRWGLWVDVAESHHALVAVDHL